MYELRNVTKSFHQGDIEIRAVDDVSLALYAGEFVAVEGPSGSGKSTLLQLLGGLDRPTEGSIMFEGHDLATLADRKLADLRLHAFGFIFQQFNLIPTLTALENVEAALAPVKMRSEVRRARAMERLEEVGLADRASHLPSQLSGGQAQRVAIARALANEARVILADEPTGNLDTRTGDEIVSLLEHLCRERGQTVLLVTHDQQISARAGGVFHMSDGALVQESG